DDAACPGHCQANCTCGAFCGDGVVNNGEQCDGAAPGAACPASACQANCTCGPFCGNNQIDPGEQCDGNGTGDCAGGTCQADCQFFGNVGSFCSGDPSRSCTDDNACSGAGTCRINTFGPPLPLSAGGVPACIIDRFASDVTGTYNLQTGSSELFVDINALVHL